VTSECQLLDMPRHPESTRQFQHFTTLWSRDFYGMEYKLILCKQCLGSEVPVIEVGLLYVTELSYLMQF